MRTVVGSREPPDSGRSGRARCTGRPSYARGSLCTLAAEHATQAPRPAAGAAGAAVAPVAAAAAVAAITAIAAEDEG